MRPANPYDIIKWGIAAFFSIALPAAAVFIWRDSWWPLAVFVLWTIAAAAFFAMLERRSWRDRSIRLLDHARLSGIRTLSHHRHDWMNDLQIIYGYLRLNKPDKAAGVVDRIRERMENDGRVSQLGHTELAVFLLSFRTVCDHMKLEVKVEDGFSLERSGLDPDKLAACIIGLVNAFRYRAAAAATGENILRLSMFDSGEELGLELVYEGEWPAGQLLSEEAADLLAGIGKWTEEEMADAPPGCARRVVVTFPLTA